MQYSGRSLGNLNRKKHVRVPLGKTAPLVFLNNYKIKRVEYHSKLKIHHSHEMVSNENFEVPHLRRNGGKLNVLQDYEIYTNSSTFSIFSMKNLN